MADNLRKTRYNARVYTSRCEDEIKAEMAKIGAEKAGIEKMIRKAQHFIVKVDGLRTPAVLILKEEMLSKGGDCAIHRDAIICKEERSSCLLMGTLKQFAQVLSDLRAQPFGLKYLADEIRSAIDNYRSDNIQIPDNPFISDCIKTMYSEMNRRTLVMGILNVNPDSFSDGGRYENPINAIEHAIKMVEEGADIIDIGGESTRPGSDPVTVDDELKRIMPVIEKIAGKVNVPISIDTYKAEVAREAINSGVSIINDIAGLAAIEMRELAAEKKTPVILMHMQGEPATMQSAPEYSDLISDIMAFLRDRTEDAVNAGVPKELIIIDPGIGFGKTINDNLKIINRLSDFKSLGFPILIGTSRKGFVGKATGGLSVSERVEGTAATVALGVNNGANIVRVHDVKEIVRVVKMTDEIIHGYHEN